MPERAVIGRSAGQGCVLCVLAAQWLLGVLLASQPAIAGVGDDPGADLDARSALEFVVDKVREIHPQTVSGFSPAVAAALDEARALAVEDASAEDAFFIINRWLTSLADAHLELRPQESAIERMDCAPLPLRWLPDGLVFTESSNGIGRGDRLLSLGTLDAPAIHDRLAQVIPVENDGRLRFLAAQRLKLGLYLRHLDVVGDDGRVSLRIENSAGQTSTRSVQLDACTPPDPDAPWVGFDVYEDASLGVFWFDRFDYNEEIVEAMGRFFEAVEENDLRKVVVDLRQKDGGDVTVAFAFLSHFEDIEWASFSVETRISPSLTAAVPAFGREAMSEVFASAGLPPIAPDAKTYVLPAPLVQASVLARMTLQPPEAMTRVSGRTLYMLTDAGTFSSGTLFAALLRDNAIGTLIGAPTGNAANFNGSELRFDLPSTDYYLNISSARLTRPDPSRGAERAIAPDVAIPTTRADLAAGNDPQLQYLIGLPIDN